MHRYIRVAAALVILFIVGGTTPTEAFDIQINANDYPGFWRIGGLDNATGNRSVELDAGEHRLDLHNVESGYVRITVDASGDVSSSDSTRVRRTRRRELEFMAHEIEMDVAGYLGRWLSGAETTKFYEGNQTLTLVPATYSFVLHGVEDSVSRYVVALDGSVRTETPGRFTSSGRNLRLVTSTVEVKLRGYPGRWISGINHASSVFLQGDQRIVLAPGTYRFNLKDVNANHFRYRFDPSELPGSELRVLDPLKATATADDTLELMTHAVRFDVDGLTTRWSFGDSISAFWGNRRLCLAPTDYRFVAAGQGSVEYRVSYDGTEWDVTGRSERLPGGARPEFSLGIGNCQSSSCDFVGTLTRVSVSSDSAESDDWSGRPDISADGSVVAFWSRATNLVTGDTNGISDVFVRDARTGTTRVSVSSTGLQGFRSDSGGFLSLSGNGRVVAFDTKASLVFGDTDRNSDVYVHDRDRGTTLRVSVYSNGATSGGVSRGVSLSHDGRVVAFGSSGFRPEPGVFQIFVHDRATGETSLVSRTRSGEPGNDWSNFPDVSADGRWVAFQSDASDLVPGDTNGVTDVFVHDRTTGETARVSVGSAGQQANDRSSTFSLSADASVVAFKSYASNLVPGDTDDTVDLFSRNLRSGEMTRVPELSVPHTVSLSGDGRYLLTNTFRNTQRNAYYVYDRQTRALCVVELPVSGGPRTVGERPVISADGGTLAFAKLDSMLIPNDTNFESDVFTYSLFPFLVPVTVVDFDVRWPGIDRRDNIYVCDVLPDCDLIGTIGFAAEIGDRFVGHFDGADFPQPEREEDRSGFSIFVRLDLSQSVLPASESFFEVGDWELNVVPSSGPAGRGDGGGAGESSGDLLIDFVELPFDVDGSGFVGDSEGEGVLLFFAQTVNLVEVAEAVESFDLTLSNLTAAGAFHVSEPASGLPPLPTTPEPTDEPRTVGCVRMCDLEERSASAIEVGQVRIRAATVDDSMVALVVGAQAPADVAVCEGPVTDILIPESEIGGQGEPAAIEFTETCEDGQPTRVLVSVYAAVGAIEIRAVAGDGTELAPEPVAGSSAKSLAFEHPSGIDRVEFDGEQILLLEVCWNCEAVVRPSASGTCVDVAEAIEVAANVVALGAVTLTGTVADGAETTMTFFERDGDGAPGLLISAPSPNGDSIAILETADACGVGRAPSRISIRAWTDAATIVALDAAGVERDSATSSSLGGFETLSLFWADGIAAVEVYGTQMLFDEICWDCMDRPDPARLIRGDCNADGNVDISDASCVLNWLFLGTANPPCIAAANSDGDAEVNITDAIYLLRYLFLGGTPPLTPFPDCGPLDALDRLSCEAPPKFCDAP